MKPAARLVAAVTILTGAFQSPVYAVIVAQHSGSTDPTTSGWTPSAGSVPSSVAVGPINDGGTPAWFVDDANQSAGSEYFYDDVLSPAEAVSAGTIGWTLSVTLRVPSTGDPAGLNGPFSYSPFASYYDGARYWWLGFDNSGLDTRVQTVTGFPILSGSQGALFTVPGGASTYNTYTLQKAPGELTASLYINGALASSTYQGALLAGPAPVVQWGAGYSLDSGRGNFNSVTFDIAAVPEAGSFVLVGSLGCAAFGVRRWRRRGRLCC